ncbi:MAG: isochorismatase family protein [Pseudomonadota bacterium]|nr:isochorismatase family protein [Pseudomonadota bacterium]
MQDAPPVTHSLIDVEDSVLVVIDVQDAFLNKYDRLKCQRLTARIAWILRVAEDLGVPVVAMAEDIPTLGGLTAEVAEALPEGTRVHSKDFFGLAGNPEILADVKATGRGTAVLVGMETDVCVAQSALGLVGEGFRVAALQDALATAEADEEFGLARMRGAGVAILSVKSLYYEWMRSVSRTHAVQANHPGHKATRPTDLVL